MSVSESSAINGRITRDDLFMSVAHAFSDRSTCVRARVGAVIVRDRHLLTHGYNGSPPGADHCLDVGCAIGDDGGCERTIHAEANALAFAARVGISVEGATLYCTHEPCYRCAQLLLVSGIAEVIYDQPYREGASHYLMGYGVPCLRRNSVLRPS